MSIDYLKDEIKGPRKARWISALCVALELEDYGIFNPRPGTLIKDSKFWPIIRFKAALLNAAKSCAITIPKRASAADGMIGARNNQRG